MDDLKDGRQHLWNKNRDDGRDSDNMSDADIHDSNAKSQQHSHYAADRNIIWKMNYDREQEEGSREKSESEQTRGQG